METIIKYNRGDVREDGMVFWARYRGTKEIWVTQEKFESNKKRHALQEKKYQDSNKDLLKIRRKENRIKNGDHIRKREREWWANNPQKTKTLIQRKYKNQSPEKRSQIMRHLHADIYGNPTPPNGYGGTGRGKFFDHEEKRDHFQDLFRTLLYELMTANTRVHELEMLC